MNKRKIKGFNLIEIIATIIIIGILATLAIVRYGPTREQVFDREAQASLRLIQAAEKLYRVRFVNTYYTSPGAPLDNDTINNVLKLDLPTINPRWGYQTFSTGCVQAARTSGMVRYWCMHIIDTVTQAGAGCP